MVDNPCVTRLKVHLNTHYRIIEYCEMECTVVFRCDCNNKTYPSKSALHSHKKTKTHKAWEETKELRQLKIQLTEHANTIVALNSTISLLKELNTTLIKRLDIEKL